MSGRFICIQDRAGAVARVIDDTGKGLKGLIARCDAALESMPPGDWWASVKSEEGLAIAPKHPSFEGITE